MTKATSLSDKTALRDEVVPRRSASSAARAMDCANGDCSA